MVKKERSHIDTGRLGEQIAAKYLMKKKVLILSRNIQTPYGEIDLIGETDDCLIFFEVKTRRKKHFGYPESSVHSTKQEHMVNSAIAYLQDNDELERPWRIDVIAVNLFASKPPEIKWFKNAIIS